MSSIKSSDASKASSSSAKEISKQVVSESSKDEYSDKTLRKLYRSYLSTIIVSSRAVDKVAHNTSDQKGSEDDAEVKKSVDAVVSTAHKIKRTATILEERLCGNAKESEALHFFQRSQPTWHDTGRKRKFTSIYQNQE